MRPHHMLEDSKTTEQALRPWIVLVQAGLVVGEYPAAEAEAADRAAGRLALAGGHHVDVFEVAAHLPPPPKVGTELADPETLGWINVGHARP